MYLKLKRWFWIVIFLLSPAIMLEAYFRGNWYSILHSYSLGMFFGIISYVWFANTLILSGRLPVFDRLFGQDRIMIFHGYMAVAALICGFTHASLKYMYFGFEGVQVKLGSLAIILFTSVSAVTILFMVQSFILRIPFIKSLRKFFTSRLGFDYTRLKLFHNITAIAIILLIVHILMASPTKENIYRLSLTGTWGAFAVIIYLYHKVFRFLWRKRQALTVTAVEPLSDDVFCISAKSEKYKPRHRPGQFGYLRLLSNICGIEEHPFTIASAPKSETLDIVIKNLGDYTGKLKSVPQGTELCFDGPYGIFTPELNKHPCIFLAGGIGITPFMSIISEWSKMEINKPVTLLWSVKRKEDLVDQGLFDRLSKEKDNFEYIKVLTRNPDGESKHIDQELLEEVLKSDGMENPHAYLCGPGTFQSDISRILKKLGIPRRNLHYESFGN